MAPLLDISLLVLARAISVAAHPNAITVVHPLQPRATSVNPATVAGVPTECISSASLPQYSSLCQIEENLYDPPNSHNVDYWCNDPNLNDEATVLDMWEGERSIGGYLDVFAYNNQTGWVDRMVKMILPDVGDTNIDGCGVIASQKCDPAAGTTACSDIVTSIGLGGGQGYWILRALAGFQSKLDIAEQYLQDATIDSLLSVSGIAADFNAPPAPEFPPALASLLSSAFFLAGGIGGVVGVAATSIGNRASQAEAAAAGSLGELKSTEALTDEEVGGSATGYVLQQYENQASRDIEQVGLEQDAANAQALAAAALKTNKYAGVATAGVYLVGSIFGQISSGINYAKANQPTGDGTVSVASLDDALKQIFGQARTNLQSIGRLVAGRPLGNETNAYKILPGQNGTGTNSVAYESDIGAFFSDGRMLLGDSNTVLNATIETAFTYIQSKLVDSALQQASYRIALNWDIKTEADCGPKNYGSQWLTPAGSNAPYCFQMYQKDPNSADGAYNAVPHSFYDNMQSKYGFNMDGFYVAAYDCNKNGDSSRLPNLTAFPPGSRLPRCFFGIEAGNRSTTHTKRDLVGTHFAGPGGGTGPESYISWTKLSDGSQMSGQ